MIIQKLQNYFTRNHDVAAAYLFGSATTGTTSVNDLDILVLQREGADRFVLHAQIVEQLANSLEISADKIDLVFFDLQETEPALLYTAINEGILLKTDTSELLSDKIEALSRYFLINEPMIRRAEHLKIERLEAFCEG